MDYSKSSSSLRLIRGGESVFKQSHNSDVRSKPYVAPVSERLCVIRCRDGVKMELRGNDAPSVAAILQFFKKQKEARSRRSSPESLRERMARDLRLRAPPRAPSYKSGFATTGLNWWERIGTLKT